MEMDKLITGTYEYTMSHEMKYLQIIGVVNFLSAMWSFLALPLRTKVIIPIGFPSTMANTTFLILSTIAIFIHIMGKDSTSFKLTLDKKGS